MRLPCNVYTKSFNGWLLSFGQNISVTFSGIVATARIDSVAATNLTTYHNVTLPGNERLILSVNSGIPAVSELSERGMVFPNPFSGRATFTTVVKKSQTVYLNVQNVVGQVVSQAMDVVQPGNNLFDLTLAAAGIYLVSLTTEEGTVSYKVICTDATTAKNSIRYLGSGANDQNNQTNQNTPSFSALKSLNTASVLGYTPGDVIHYKRTSGIYTTIVTDSLITSKNYEVEFAACTDPDGDGYRTSGIVGGKLKETGTSHWSIPNAVANNSLGFTALPCGIRYSGGFDGLGGYGYFWSATGKGTSNAWYRTLDYGHDGVYR